MAGSSPLLHSAQMSALRTNRPFALAANASAETARAHCTQFSAARRYSPDRPLVWAKTGEIQTDPSLRLASTVETRTKLPFATVVRMTAICG